MGVIVTAIFLGALAGLAILGIWGYSTSPTYRRQRADRYFARHHPIRR